MDELDDHYLLLEEQTVRKHKRLIDKEYFYKKCDVHGLCKLLTFTP